MVPERGHYKIFLGMAAGVGKTYRMLQEGHAELENGRDVVIGLLETHAREETAALAEGLELVPRRRVEYREQQLEEMDLPAILRRRPEVCLVDELAHTNVPGVEHEKRYEDIEAVLAAGIHVISTVNVQHLESLNDRIAELTGVTVRETIPDGVLGRADEIVLIDVSPEALLDRLRAGKVYPAARIDAALNNFFRIENLAALRETALRQVAEEVEAKRIVTERFGTRTDNELLSETAPQAVGERLMALVEPYPGAQRLVRRAWRSAQRLGSQLDILWIQRPGQRLTVEQESSLSALRTLASVLGANLLIEESDMLADTVARVAAERGTTYILLGRSREPRGLARLRTSAAAAADAAPAGRRRPHRRRPRAAPRADAMIALLTLIAGVVGGVALGLVVRPRLRTTRRPAEEQPSATRQILLPFTGTTLSRRALDAAMRLAKVEGATLMPAFLATVPLHQSLESPLPKQCAIGMPLLETIEQRAVREGVPVDARVERGRSYRHALSRLLEREQFDRVIISAADDPRSGFSGDDLLWAIDHADAEVMILRPAPQDTRVVSAGGLAGHF